MISRIQIFLTSPMSITEQDLPIMPLFLIPQLPAQVSYNPPPAPSPP